MTGDAAATTRPGFPILSAYLETCLFLWREKWWLLVRALLPAVITGVAFVLTYPARGLGLYAAWQIALTLIAVLFIANMLVSTHRHFLMGERCNKVIDFLPRMVDLTFLGVWIALALGYWVFHFIGGILGLLVPMAGAVFDFGFAILYIFVLVRLTALFPLVAMQQKTPFRAALHLSEHQLGRLLVFAFLGATTISLIIGGVGALLYLVQQWPAMEPETELMARLLNLRTTASFFAAPLCLMIGLEAVAVATSVAYRALETIKAES